MLRRRAVMALTVVTLLACLSLTKVQAEIVEVTVIVHEACSVSDSDCMAADDLFCRAWADEGNKPLVETDDVSDTQHIYREWRMVVAEVDSQTHPVVRVHLQLWDRDSFLGFGDDHFDICPSHGKCDVEMDIDVKNRTLAIPDLPGWETARCSGGKIKSEGYDDAGDWGYVVFSVEVSRPGTNGDSDNDGLYDSWELCGYDADYDTFVDVDLPAMGANPFRKDVFVEIDWMTDGTNHTHAPWLPALINAWEEFERTHVTYPNVRSGMALHLDVGNLYAGYGFNTDGNGASEIDVGLSGIDADGNGTKESLDLDGDGIADIGNLGALGRPMTSGTPGGGNELPETAILNASIFTGHFGQGSTFYAIRNTPGNFAAERQGIFRYCIFAHAASVTAWGLAEPVLPCDDFAITLGDELGQTVDTQFDGHPDKLDWLQAQHIDPWVVGPCGPAVPVRGTVAQHTSVFMHELGHALGLDEGGGDSVTCKPNYISIMNYVFGWWGMEFDLDGNGASERLWGIDLNHDGAYDVGRFMYSYQECPSLDESNLNENEGIGPTAGYTCLPVVTIFGPWEGGLWGAGLRAQSGVGCLPIDWSRGDSDGDGISDNDIGVSHLKGLPGALTDLNNDGSIAVLKSFNDCQYLAANTLRVSTYQDHPYIGRQEYERMIHNRVRVRRLPNEQAITSSAKALYRITFEPNELGLDPLQELSDEYYRHLGIPVVFEAAAGASKPMIVGPAELVGPTGTPVPTQSGAQALRKREDSALVMTFPTPPRMVGLYLGRLIAGDEKNMEPRAVLRAFDTDGFPMYEDLITFPPRGVTKFVGLGSVLASQPIYKIELHYEHGGSPLDVYIDDLILCSDLKRVAPQFPSVPPFGQRDVAVNVRAEPSGSLTSVPIAHEGKTGLTDFTFTAPEGSSTTLEAPAKVGDWYFLSWKMGETVYFPRYQTKISLDLLRDVTLNAVYTLQPPRRCVQVALGSIDTEDGLANTQRGEGTDGENEPKDKTCGPVGDLRRVRCNWGSQDPTPDAPDNYMYFNVLDPSVKQSPEITISAEVYEAGIAGTVVTLQYTNGQAQDATDLANVFATHPTSYTLGNSNAWVALQWKIDDAGFRTLMQNSSDFRLSMTGRVCVDTVSACAPVPLASIGQITDELLAVVGRQ